MTSARSRRALWGMALVVVAAVPHAAQAQGDWRMIATDSAQAIPLPLGRPAFVWLELRGAPSGTSINGVITVAGATALPVPNEGLYLPAGDHLLTVTPAGDLLPDSLALRIRTAERADRRLNGDSAPPLPLETPIVWNGARSYRLTIPDAGSVALVSAGFGPRVTWRSLTGEERAAGNVIQVPGPTELLVTVDGDRTLPDAMLMFRSFEGVDDFEPNDSPLLAAPVALDEWIELSVGQPGDLDHFAVELPVAGTLSADWGMVPSGVGPVAVAVNDAGETIPLPATLAAGKRIIRVGAGDQAWSPQTLSVRLHLVRAITERSASRSGMPSLTWEQPVTLDLAAPGYADSLSFVVRGRGTVQFVTESGDPTLQPMLRIRPSDRAAGDSAVVNAVDLAARLEPATYVAVFSYLRPPPDSSRFATVRGVFSADEDANEPNDQSADATPVKIPGRIEGRLEAPNDVDRFRLTLERPAILRLTRAKGTLFLSRGVRVYLHSLATNRFERPRTVQGPSLDIRFAVDPGTYIVTVRSDSVWDVPYSLDAAIEAPHTHQAIAGLGVAMIGMRMGMESRRYVRQSSRVAGALYYDVYSSEALAASLDIASASLLADLYKPRWPRAAIALAGMSLLVLLSWAVVRRRARVTA